MKKLILASGLLLLLTVTVCRSKNAGVAGYAEAFRPVQSDSQTSEWYSYFENDVLVLFLTLSLI